jgi:hypothetical protein
MGIVTHGQTRGGRRSGTYYSCAGALDRCYNPLNKSYSHYQARGIGVAPRWWVLADFVTGVLAEIGPRPQGMTLDRLDNSHGYIPGNLRWATPKAQRANQSRRKRT